MLKQLADALARKRGYTPFHELPPDVQARAWQQIAEDTPHRAIMAFLIILLGVYFGLIGGALFQWG